MLVNNKANDWSGSDKHKNKNKVLFEYNFSWLLA